MNETRIYMGFLGAPDAPYIYADQGVASGNSGANEQRQHEIAILTRKVGLADGNFHRPSGYTKPSIEVTEQRRSRLRQLLEGN